MSEKDLQRDLNAQLDLLNSSENSLSAKNSEKTSQPILNNYEQVKTFDPSEKNSGPSKILIIAQ